MAGIYERDNINYPSILAAMAQSRARSAEREGDTIRKNGEIWGNALDKLGGMGARTMDYLQAMRESPEARLKKLEEEKRIAEIEKAYNEQVDQRRAVNKYLMTPRSGTDMFRRPEVPVVEVGGYDLSTDAANGMKGYTPTTFQFDDEEEIDPPEGNKELADYAKFMGIYQPAVTYGMEDAYRRRR